MFDTAYEIQSIQDAVARIQHVSDSQSFQSLLCALRKYLKNIGMDGRTLIELEKRAYYLPNEYSQKDTSERMEEAKSRVLEYMLGIIDDPMDEKLLIQVMENFYMFLEILFEKEPHKKAGIHKNQLECLKIKNEYDVQHLLYAYLKPLYPLIRREVNEDTGYSTVRADLILDKDLVIEIKYTRSGMALKKLTEEIEADMVHYGAKKIYFFIYDKGKIIGNPLNFKAVYEEKMKDKRIYIIIHQPKIL
ncbi:MAG: hypothetical protein HFH35_05350 [Eubacterium sp.]|nr:hypothetical protein [Eubacterium sp.]